MSEYITSIDPDSYVLRGSFNGDLREEVVRCRDCANHGPREGFGCPGLGARSNGFCA